MSVCLSHRVLSLGGLLCCLLYAGCAFDDEANQQVPIYSTQLSIINRTHELQTITVTLTNPNESINCDIARLHPGWYFRDRFDTSTTRQTKLFSGQEIPVHPNQWFDTNQGYLYDYAYDYNQAPCNAVKIDTPNAPSIVAFWDQTFGYKTFYLDVDIPKNIPSDIHTIELRADYSNVSDDVKKHPWRYKPCPFISPNRCSPEERAEAATPPKGTVYSWGSTDSIKLFEQIDTRPPLIGKCTLTRAMAWSHAFQDTSFSKIERITQNSAGASAHQCNQLTTPSGTANLCLPFELSKLFKRDDVEVWIRLTRQAASKTTIDIQYIDNARVLRQQLNLQLYRGKPTSGLAQSITVHPDTTCAPTQSSCNPVVVVANATFTFNNSSYIAKPNEWTNTPSGDIFLNRAHVPVTTTCNQLEGYIEYAILNRTTQFQ